MWNCRKSVLLPAKRRKAGARPRARVTSRRELRGGERAESCGTVPVRGGPGGRSGGRERRAGIRSSHRGPAAPPGTARHGSASHSIARCGAGTAQQRPAAGLRGSTSAAGTGPPRPLAAGPGGRRTPALPPGTPRTSAAEAPAPGSLGAEAAPTSERGSALPSRLTQQDRCSPAGPVPPGR